MESVEKRSELHLPKKDRHLVLPENSLRIERNGIDRVKTETRDAGLLYEDFCFEELLELFPQDFVIGPRLIDYIADNCRSTFLVGKHKARPDAFILSNYLSRTYLSGVVESKSGWEPDLINKAEGLRWFPAEVEKDPGGIYRCLKLAIGDVLDSLPIYPNSILPLEDKLEVIFMTNYEVAELREPFPNLKFTYLRRELPSLSVAAALAS